MNFKEISEVFGQPDEEFTKNVKNLANEQILKSVEDAYRSDVDLHQREREMLLKWLRWVVSSEGMLFGILVTLGSSSNKILCIRICFALAICSVAMSILCLGVCLYSELHYLRKQRSRLEKETRTAIAEYRSVDYHKIVVHPEKIFGTLEKAGYICLAFALISLCVYAVLQVIFP